MLAPGCAAGLAVLVLAAWPVRGKYLAGANDFANFYAAGRLAGSGQLYQAEAFARELARLPVTTEPALQHYVRPPFLAALLWPVARLPYEGAHWLWQALCAAALAVFLWRWKAAALGARLLAAAWSYPLLMCFLSGEDLVFLLLWVALAVDLMRREKPLAAGAVLALCSAKFHLFWLLPLLVAGQKRWRLGAGLLTGGAGLAAVSFAVQGLSWPREHLQTLLRPGAHPLVSLMPNLNGAAEVLGLASWWQWVLAAPVVACVWRVIRRHDFEVALTAVLVGGLLVSYHCYAMDYVLCLPGCLTLLARPGSLSTRALALMLLTPMLYLLPVGPYPPGNPLASATAALLLASLAWERRGGQRTAPAASTQEVSA